MGTKAVFAIASGKDSHFTKIIGMTYDGSPGRLEYLSYLFMDIARQLRILSKVKRRNQSAIETVMDAIDLGTDGMFFTDSVSNAQWVSYSCIFDPATNIIQHYDKLFESKTKTFDVPNRVGSSQSKKCVDLWREKNK